MILHGKTVLVTGGGRGIGRALVAAAAREGAIVGVNYNRSIEQALALKQEMQDVHLLHADVRDAKAVDAMIGAFVKQVGRLDIVINNAGVHYPELLIRKSAEKVRDEVLTNLVGAVHVTKAALPFMVKQRSGLLVGISSVAATHPRAGLAVYAATKAGLETFLQGVAREYRGRGISTCCFRLGVVETDMLAHMPALERQRIVDRTGAGRPISPEDAAVAMLRIAAASHGLQTGAVMTLDGGYSLGAD